MHLAATGMECIEKMFKGSKINTERRKNSSFKFLLLNSLVCGEVNAGFRFFKGALTLFASYMIVC
jgi:hypothetical protein